MSERIDTVGVSPHISLLIDPSVGAMPSEIGTTYMAMNHGIAVEHNASSHGERHLRNSHRAISDTAESARNRFPADQPARALVLGAGNCFDLPLEEIASTFDHTTFVEVDVLRAQQALETQLPPRLLGKVSLIGADITGVMGGFSANMLTLVKETPELSEFVRAALPLMQGVELAGRQPEMGNEYAFVCSQLLMTQLGNLPIAGLRTEIEKQYGIPDPLSAVKLLGTFDTLSRRIHHSHIAHLARLVSPKGAVHLADTYSKMENLLTSRPNLIPMILDDVMQPIIDAQFAAIAPAREWSWLATTDGSFRVVSHSLAPRKGLSPVNFRRVDS